MNDVSGEYQPDTVADALHRDLRSRIWEGEFMPGDRVSIRAVAQEHGLSVIPVRDAVRRLVAEGALRFADSRTIEVPRLSLTNHRDVVFARMQIEPEAARRAFEHLTQADLNELVRHDMRVNTAIETDDRRLYMKSNFDFHFLIYRRANAPTLMRIIEMLWLQSGPSMRYISSQYGSAAFAIDYHRAATDALAARDGEGFVAAIRSDIGQGMEYILRAERELVERAS
ncbi:GntR family transcriptional regulator [Ancylobacter defluvii]|uniref:GntR family transcriptional regulator n=1 Tax=Ancylobacter defluvii TaxID=1282440 RepID=A0A9W6JTY8_9HYPH|nr:GntR family transcriptional regulator [Ancylobacter defluvii]MBS7588525.1 GntR family transcriptional regulator [Ancylobacter defluvii]GLK83805.1 GntR family transcriptional regulator [Ancylobacter defluvii]